MMKREIDFRTEVINMVNNVNDNYNEYSLVIAENGSEKFVIDKLSNNVIVWGKTWLYLCTELRRTVWA